MSMQPIALPVRRALEATAIRRLATIFADWADTQERAADYWHTVGDDSAAADAYGQVKAYKNCANKARELANTLSPEEPPDAD